MQNEQIKERIKNILIKDIVESLSSLSIRELEDIKFKIDNRESFLGKDSTGIEIYNYPQSQSQPSNYSCSISSPMNMVSSNGR